MQADDPIEQLEGTSLDARFTLGALVARGGYGAVYRGTHRALGCPVAIKVLAVPDTLRASERDRFVDAFQREAQIIAALRHPAIVRVIDFGVTPVEGLDHPLIVFEWIEGQTLDAWLRARARGLSPREALALLRPVLDAIAAVHEAGVAHRDLKPANVMVSASSRGAWEPKVLDFGVAKSFAPDEAPPDWTARTADPHTAFSLTHAAPEQLGRLRTGPWTDVHALALLVVEALLGRPAYRGDTALALYASISDPRRPTPARHTLDVGPWEAVLDRALALNPGARQSDAGALLADLEGTLDDAQRAFEAARDEAAGASTRVSEPDVVPVTTATAPEAPRRGRGVAAAAAALLALVLVGATHGAARGDRLPSPSPSPSPVVREVARPAAVAPTRLSLPDVVPAHPAGALRAHAALVAPPTGPSLPLRHPPQRSSHTVTAHTPARAPPTARVLDDIVIE